MKQLFRLSLPAILFVFVGAVWSSSAIALSCDDVDGRIKAAMDKANSASSPDHHANLTLGSIEGIWTVIGSLRSLEESFT